MKPVKRLNPLKFYLSEKLSGTRYAMALVARFFNQLNRGNKMKILNMLLALLTVSVLGEMAQAQFGRGQHITLDFYDLEIGGQEALRLKQEIQRQHPYINLQSAELLSVELVAKSRMGRAQASLLVGGMQSGDYTIPGSPRDWHNPSEYTFNTTYLHNDRGTSQGPWQIIITGNVKVRRVHLTIMQRHPRPVPGPRPVPVPMPSRVISVKGHGYYPSELTAHAICILNGYSGAMGFTQWRQAGNIIQGQYSRDGRPYFETLVWSGGMAINEVTCR